MKIIGDMGGTLTVQMEYQEFAEITGLRVDPNGDVLMQSRLVPVERLGAYEFAIREGWRRLHALNGNRPELQKAIKQLRAIADVLEPMELVVFPDPPEDDQGEGKAVSQ